MTPPTVVHASPTKDFFISMVTRDISLQDCILDLLDNSVDGAREEYRRARASSNVPTVAELKPFEGYVVDIHFDPMSFSIHDNCGGISLSDAVDYAFHFGRRKDAGPSTDHGIGLYGIGMKRAIFKIGRFIVVESSTSDDSFQVPIDVDQWASDLNDWDFPLEPLKPFDPHGTRIEIAQLYPAVAAEFGDLTFASELATVIGRDYALLIQGGLTIKVNGDLVRPMEIGFLSGNDFEPFQYKYDDGEVSVEIVAGVSRVPPDDDAPGEPEKPETRTYGWFVTCNERVVLAGNKDERTVWGYEGFPRWHPQFNGFVGVVHFRASDPRQLPWTTTKRDIDVASTLYQRARTPMMEATRTFIDYTNSRKERLEEARRREQSVPTVNAKPKPGVKIMMKVPRFEAPSVKMTAITYRVPLAEYEAVRRTMGDITLTRPQVGLRTFDFYKSRMLPEE